ncbi:uncharacterized protein EI97DRAFT_440991 [Westerdykella ornata]|uniref:Uncharacterized protein n=1 Tax=Westerdykella ornata TaxID=318751 RepID=A0A6A6JPT7_WESOR|nr:uncharacterized protein EI97DRAFT_440991 [Westerdykella ornata]KAF2278542.1 hypothetical protein EI97DRAFT_440991 [Westerdykella ornata]
MTLSTTASPSPGKTETTLLNNSDSHDERHYNHDHRVRSTATGVGPITEIWRTDQPAESHQPTSIHSKSLQETAASRKQQHPAQRAPTNVFQWPGNTPESLRSPQNHHIRRGLRATVLQPSPGFQGHEDRERCQDPFSQHETRSSGFGAPSRRGALGLLCLSMPPVRDHNAPRANPSPTKPTGVVKRSHLENKERAYVAASRRSDRSLEARLESAHQASNIHFERTGRRLVVNADIVEREEMYEEEDPAHQLRMMRAGSLQYRNLDNNILDLLQQSALARAHAQWMPTTSLHGLVQPTMQMFQMNQGQPHSQENGLQSPGSSAGSDISSFSQQMPSPAPFTQQSQSPQPQGLQFDSIRSQQQVSSPQIQGVSPQQMQKTPSAQQPRPPQPTPNFQQLPQTTGLSSFRNFDGQQISQHNPGLSPVSVSSEYQEQQKQYEFFLRRQSEHRHEAYMPLRQQHQHQQHQWEQYGHEQQPQEQRRRQEQPYADPFSANLKSENLEIEEPAPFTKPQQPYITTLQDKLVEVQQVDQVQAPLPFESPLFANLNLLEFETQQPSLSDDAVKNLLDEYDWSRQEFGAVETYA